MRRLVFFLASACFVGCTPSGEVGERESAVEAGTSAWSFDGADYSTAAEKLAHGERLAKLLNCNRIAWNGISETFQIPRVECSSISAVQAKTREVRFRGIKSP